MPRTEILYNLNSLRIPQLGFDSGEGGLTTWVTRLDRLALFPGRLQGTRSDRMVNPI
jgi:hypothetical protein